jgi:hypothetical protein
MSHPIHLATDKLATDKPSLEPRLSWRAWPLLVEFALLGLAAPLLYFPERVQTQLANLCACEANWVVPLGLVLLALMWPLRHWSRARRGTVVTPRLYGLPLVARWALWFWFVVMLPVAIWAAPPPLREQYAFPRALILVWNFSLFWSVLAHAGQGRRALGWLMVGWLAAIQAIALVAPFGMEARTKLPVVGELQELIPRPLLGQFSGAEAGFSTNQVAGVLLYVLPLLVALWVAGLTTRGWRWWLLTLCSGWIGATLLLSQSRGGLLGMVVALLIMPLLVRRWGWYALGLLVAAVAAIAFFLPADAWGALDQTVWLDTVGGISTVQDFRTMVWEAATLAMQDFFFTGMGLGTFRVLVYLLYPLPGISPSLDLAHAHNFFLQNGVDFGVPGLVAILLLYGAAIIQLVRLAHSPVQAAIWPSLPFLTPRVLAIGWMGCMVGQTFYSLFDAVAMGSKPNFVWWWWLALIFAAAYVLLPVPGATESAA